MLEFGPPRTGVHCPVCRSHRVKVDLLAGGEFDVRIIHYRCRARWNPALRRAVERDVLDELAAQGMFVADYCETPPRHVFGPVRAA
jgi:hypothetical protein